MENLRMAIGNEIEWIQPKINQRSYVLCTGDTVFASLRFETSFGSLASAEAADGSWTFKRVGFFKTHVTVRRAGEETDLAVYTPNWFGTEGAIQFTGGRSYTWKPANFWATQYQIQDSLEKVVLTYKSGKEHSNLPDLFKVQARVEIDPAYENIPEISLLVLLGWYLMILRHDDDTTAAAAATTALS
ncbi:MAG: hypothetical protein ACM3PY_04605 [Omnitrophica WOR_2 bacterium]